MPWGRGASQALLQLAGRVSERPGARRSSHSEMNEEPWATSQDQAAADLTPSPARPDKLCLDSFWSEVETIRQGGSYSESDGARRDSKNSEEGEQEVQWLQDAGLSTLISGVDGGHEDEVEKAVLLSTLTRTQAAAVQRRLDSYTCSLRRRNKPSPRDVRDVFAPLTAPTTVPESQYAEHRSPESRMETPPTAVSVEPQVGTQREEIFITDIAYCEQAAILLKQAKLPQNSTSRRKDDGTLPKVICPQCRLGVTHIQDLSQADMKKVRQLALIDMTALCDLLELEVKRHKTCKRRMPEGALFGVPLAVLVESDQKLKSCTSIPLVLQALLSFLEKKGIDSEGILRVPGSQSRIKMLQQKLESTFYSGDFNWDEVSPNDAAALLKKLIRELPSPLLSAEYLNTFSAVRDIPELKQKLHMLNLLVILLPEANRHTLKALLEFLSKVVSREKRNRMNLWAVSTIMAPNLFLHKAVPSRLTEGMEKGQAERAADIMRLLIRYQDLLWTVPNFLMSQVRKLNENSSRRYQFYDKRIKNLLRKIHTDSRDKPEKPPSEPCRTVKIQVGDILSSSVEVHLNINSRAADLLAQVHQDLCRSDSGKGLKRNGCFTYHDCAIYEVGGNIGEHCLDPNTHLLDLYNSNPGGEWVIKLKSAANRGL
ncbi:rho GTPase-activating protein 40 [Brienomyrus brachyistius]|uniref:rho GTPase-activating protein 40 n=1 Tax=Brienomyrus brachyistius TaxID=42636 RepID=UPI0020B36367|nr:rho GTPase-activating protein 40 [Brienomyrus brachyistius]